MKCLCLRHPHRHPNKSRKVSKSLDPNFDLYVIKFICTSFEAFTTSSAFFTRIRRTVCIGIRLNDLTSLLLPLPIILLKNSQFLVKNEVGWGAGEGGGEGKGQFVSIGIPMTRPKIHYLSYSRQVTYINSTILCLSKKKESLQYTLSNKQKA